MSSRIEKEKFVGVLILLSGYFNTNTGFVLKLVGSTELVIEMLGG